MAKKPTLVWLDPEAVTVHPDNVRKDLGDLRDLTRDVRENGVLVPGVVVPTDDGYLLLCGQRRRAAAITAEQTMPFIVRHDLTDQPEQIARMLAENLHRKPLTVGEEGAGYEQLAAFDLSDTEIARFTGMTRQHVQKARKVAGSEVASTVADRYDLTLDQALTLAEFEGDPQAVKHLVATAKKNPGQFKHVASRLRFERDQREAFARAVESLTAEGYTVLEPYGDHGKARKLGDLTEGEGGAPISPEAHASCPGRAAIVYDHSPDAPRYVCLDPAAHGHCVRSRSSEPSKPTPMSEEAKAERRQVIENNKAWRAAEPVRMEHTRSVLARRRPPAGTLRFVTEAIVSAPGLVGRGEEALVADLLGLDQSRARGRRAAASQIPTCADVRLPLLLLAQVAADCEQGMGVHTWRRPDADAARWLAFLAGTGYELSPIEQLVVGECAPATTGEAVDGEADAVDAAA